MAWHHYSFAHAFEGFGVALSWLALDMKQRLSPAQIADHVRSIFGPVEDDCLDCAYVRYNIGSTQYPAGPAFRDGGAVPAYNDQAQLEMVLAAVKLRGNKPTVIEAFSNSPLQSLTCSGSTQGNVVPLVDNIALSKIPAFATFLVQSVRELRSKGLDVSILSPVNEPSSPVWRKGCGQEACFWSVPATRALFAELFDRGVKLGIMEENNCFDAARNAWMVRGSLSDEIHLHTYSLTQFSQGFAQGVWAKMQDADLWRRSLRDRADNTGQKLVVSEFAIGSPAVTGTNGGVLLIDHIVRDFETLRPERWAYWQFWDSFAWGLIDKDTQLRTPAFYGLLELSRLFPVGCTGFWVQRDPGKTVSVQTLHGILACNLSETAQTVQIPQAKYRTRSVAGTTQTEWVVQDIKESPQLDKQSFALFLFQ